MRKATNILCPASSFAEILRMVDRQLSIPRTWSNALGNGQAAPRVVDVLLDTGTDLRASGHR